MRLDGFKDKTEAISWLKRHKGIRTAGEAEKYLRAHLPYEKHYQGNIIRYIQKNYPSAFVWKAAANGYARAGIPDVCVIYKGRFYGFEVKRPYIGVPSKIQIETIRRIRAAGGVAEIVCFTAEVERIMEGGRK